MQPYLEFAIGLAKEAGAIMLENFKLDMKKEWKSDDSALTVTDTTINDLVIERVKAAYPGHAVLGEEANFPVDGSDYVWVVDPVDGTAPFSHGVPCFAFSLALTHKGESIVGVINDPVMGRLLSAEKGTGAFMNGQPIKVSDSPTLAHTMLNIDGPRDDAFSETQIRKTINERKGRTTKLSSLVYGGMLVALGEYVAETSSGWYPWDIAALKVIVEEAGGKVTSLRGEEQLYDRKIQGALISNGLVHAEVLEMINSK